MAVKGNTTRRAMRRFNSIISGTLEVPVDTHFVDYSPWGEEWHADDAKNGTLMTQISQIFADKNHSVSDQRESGKSVSSACDSSPHSCTLILSPLA
jgi:hypothetical protein